MISILILTKNEQQDLPECLKSVSWSDDIHVFDSCSSDRTVEIATEFGAKVTQRSFDDWSTHQNWGLRNLPFKYPWVFYIDADERMTIELIEAVKQSVLTPKKCVAFRVSRRDYFKGVWLKHVTPSPFNIRLFIPNKIHYERATNPITIVDGNIGEIDEHFNHFPFSKGISHWFDKHNGYSSLEAIQIIKNRQNNFRFSFLKMIFSKNKNERRYYQKEFYYKLPLRPLAMFILLYFIRRGFLDRGAGLTYSLLRSMYEYMIVLKVSELESSNKE